MSCFFFFFDKQKSFTKNKLENQQTQYRDQTQQTTGPLQGKPVATTISSQSPTNWNYNKHQTINDPVIQVNVKHYNYIPQGDPTSLRTTIT